MTPKGLRGGAHLQGWDLKGDKGPIVRARLCKWGLGEGLRLQLQPWLRCFWRWEELGVQCQGRGSTLGPGMTPLSCMGAEAEL